MGETEGYDAASLKNEKKYYSVCKKFLLIVGFLNSPNYTRLS
jgi:hypothetical protein